MSPDSGPKVEYPVKELLDKLGDQIVESAKDVKAEVARLASLIETKASKESVAALAKTVTELDLRLTGRLNAMESQQGETRGFSKGTWVVLAIAVPAFIAVLVGVIYVLSAGGHS